MAKLPAPFDPATVAIRSALSEGRKADAVTLVIEQLNRGASRQVQRLAAELLRPDRKPAGGQKTAPKHWFEIGVDYAEMRAAGETHDVILQTIADRYGYSETHVRNARNYYEAALCEG